MPGTTGCRVTRDKIAYLYQRAEIDPIAVLKMKRTVAVFSQHQTWHPTRYEPGKVPLALPDRKRVVRSVVINPKRFLGEDGVLEIYMPGYGSDEQGNLQPVAELEFKDGELKLSWMTERHAYDEVVMPRDKEGKAQAATAVGDSNEKSNH
jgi:hypothetical protein